MFPSHDLDENTGVLYDNYGTPNEAESGLLGVLNNVTLMHNIENDQVGVFEKSNGVILPKLIEVSLNFSPIHEHTIGWLEDGFSNEAFPYGAPLAGTAPYVSNKSQNELTKVTSVDQMSDAQKDEAEAKMAEFETGATFEEVLNALDAI